MGAVPKRRISKSRGRKRRASWVLKPKQLVTCPGCGAPVRPHHVCLACGAYRSVQVFEIEEEE